jgi:hypothetical protein
MAIGGQDYGVFRTSIPGIPGPKGTPTRGDLFIALERLIARCDRLISNSRSIWESGTLTNGEDLECPISLLDDFPDTVKRVLSNIGPVGAAPLRRFVRMDFWRPKANFQTESVQFPDRPVPVERRVLTSDGFKEYVALIRTVRADLLRVRAKFLGLNPPARVQSKPSPRGRPRDRHINEALRMLREGIRKNKENYPNPRECWEWVFENVVLPYFEKEVWPTLRNWAGTDEQKKYQKKSLMNSLRARGGVGVPPPKKIQGK